MVYFPNYSVYARKFFPEDITNPGRFTHILYAFAKIAADGTVALSDPWADLELPVDNANPAEDQPLGCIERLQLLKKESPGLQILLSVGGWGYRENFKLPSGNVVGRERFARSAVDLVSAHKLDGLDIDWEYPESEEQGENFHDLLKAIRVQLDNVTSASNRLLLTAAVSSSQLHYQHLPIERIEDEKLLDYWLLMGYDYAGSFSATAAHASNVYPGNGDKVTPFNTEQGVDAYHQRTVPLNKIILGMPLYGHDFQNTEGLGHSYRGNSLGSWPVQGENASGIWDYKDISAPEDTIHVDEKLLASWSYDNQTRTLISYDTPQVARLKAQYILDKGLRGAMWWEISGDKADSSDSLIDSVIEVLG